MKRKKLNVSVTTNKMVENPPLELAENTEIIETVKSDYCEASPYFIDTQIDYLYTKIKSCGVVGKDFDFNLFYTKISNILFDLYNKKTKTPTEYAHLIYESIQLANGYLTMPNVLKYSNLL